MSKYGYENGYLPKIAYHLYKGNEYNVDYFILRQTKMYGEITAAQRQWIWDELDRLMGQKGSWVRHTDEA